MVSVENMNSIERNLGVNATMEEIQKEMFEGDNIVTTKTDHGLSRLKKNNDKSNEDKTNEDNSNEN